MLQTIETIGYYQAIGSALPQMLRQRVLESLGVRVVEPPTHGEDPDRPLLTG